MPTFQQGPDNVLVWINSAGVADAGEVFQVKHLNLANPPVIFEVREVGDVVIYGAIRRRGTITVRNTTAGDGTMATFKRGSNEIISFAYSAADGASIEGASSLDYDIVFRSANDVSLQVSSALFLDNGTMTVVTLQDAQCVWTDNTGAYTMSWEMEYASSGEEDAYMRVGGGNPGYRGVFRVRANTAAARPGLLKMERESGTPYYLWVDTTGRLHIHTVDPGSNDGLGTKIKDQ